MLTSVFLRHPESIESFASGSFASHAVLQGIPLPVVSRLLGHKRPSMTLRYAHVGDRETEAAAERIGAAIARAMGGGEASSSD